MRKFVSRYFLTTAALLCASVANAQDGGELVLEEVIVTAQQRVESLQDVPVSVNAVAGEKISEAGIEKIEDIALYVPNLAMSETGIGTNLYLRGIGSGINNGFEQSVGMYVDGIYYGRPQLTRVPFLDLERVEVLRGPQAILFGKNSIAGAISMITAKPTDEFEASISGLYEVEFNEREITGIVSGPIVEGLRGRVAFQKRDVDGYINNATLGRDEPERDELFVRGTLAWDVTPDFDVSLKLEYGEFNVTGRQVEITGDNPILPIGDYFVPPTLAGPFPGQTYSEVLTGVGADSSILNTTQDFVRSASGPEFSDNEMKNVTVTANWALGEHTITSITGYLNYEFIEECDCDFTGANIFTVPAQENFEQFSQEIRLTSPTGKRFEYIAGFFYQENSVDFNERFLIPEDTLLDDLVAFIFPGFAPAAKSFTVPRTYFQDTDSWAVFAQGTWNITDQLSLTVGARYSEDDKKAARELTYAEEDGSPLSTAPDPALFGLSKAFALDILIPALFKAEAHSLAGSRSESAFSPLVNLQWFYSDSGMAYFTWTRGNKSGGFDARSNASLTPAVAPRGAFEFEDEEAESFELGLKTSLFNDRAELNVALFRTEFDELQVSIFDGTLGFNVGNAATAISQGVEIDGRFLVTEELMLNFSVAYIDFEFDEFPNGQCSFNEEPTGLINRQTGAIEPFSLPIASRAPVCDYAGRTNQYVADVQAAVSADYSRPVFDNLEFRATLDVLYSDDYFASQNLDPQSLQDAYVKLNARIGIGAYDGKWEVAFVTKNLTDEDIITYANDTPLAVGLFGARGRYSFLQSPRTLAITGTYRF